MQCPDDHYIQDKNKRPKAYFFKANSKVKNPKVGSLWKAPEILRASEVRKI
jgi:hypothetical protein